jgi:hypothetical protein
MEDFSSDNLVEIFDGITQDYVLKHDLSYNGALNEIYKNEDEAIPAGNIRAAGENAPVKKYINAEEVNKTQSSGEKANQSLSSSAKIDEDEDAVFQPVPLRPFDLPSSQKPPLSSSSGYPVTPTSPRPPAPPGSIPPHIVPLPPVVRPPSNIKAIRLSADIYRKIRSLEETYGRLIRLASRQQAEELQKLLTEMRLLAVPALNIYISLSGNKIPPYEKDIYDSLPNNYCLALRVTFNRISNLYDDVLTLQKLVNIAQIDRQLIIMASVLQRQLSTLNRLLIDCLL